MSDAAYFATDRCLANVEVKRDTIVPCVLKHGHDGQHEPAQLGKQTTSESSAAQDRCQAVLKSVYRWRCTRRAGPSGLCAQHYHFGARVPKRWEHPVLPNGVVSCEPVSPFRHVAGARDAT